MTTSFARLVTDEKPKSVAALKSGKTGALVATYKSGVRAIIKPMKEALPNGSRNQRGIPVATHPMREVAYYELAKLLGFQDLVPETVLTTKAIGEVSSAQVFMPAHHLKALEPKLRKSHAPGWRDTLIETCRIVPKKDWRRLLALDIVAGVRDRHANNVGVVMHMTSKMPVYRLVAWDNAVTFGKSFKRYHNVFHKFLFRKSVRFDDIWPVWDKLDLDDFQKAIGPYLEPVEVTHAFMRMSFFKDYPYRLPWRVCSQGHDASDEFPPYLDYFEPVVETPQHLLSVA